MEAILLANEAFEQDLVVAQRNVQQLETAATNDPLVEDQLEQVRAVLLAHETILTEHKQLAADLSPDENTYRSIARVLGAILAEQEMIRLRYEDLLFSAEPVEDMRILSVWDQLPDSRYVVSPPFYERQIELARVQALPGWIGPSNRRVDAGDSLVNVASPPGTGDTSENPDTAATQ